VASGTALKPMATHACPHTSRPAGRPLCAAQHSTNTAHGPLCPFPAPHLHILLAATLVLPLQRQRHVQPEAAGVCRLHSSKLIHVQAAVLVGEA
jgi:hypothetical protein